MIGNHGNIITWTQETFLNDPYFVMGFYDYLMNRPFQEFDNRKNGSLYEDGRQFSAFAKAENAKVYHYKKVTPKGEKLFGEMIKLKIYVNKDPKKAVDVNGNPYKI